MTCQQTGLISVELISMVLPVTLVFFCVTYEVVSRENTVRASSSVVGVIL